MAVAHARALRPGNCSRTRGARRRFCHVNTETNPSDARVLRNFLTAEGRLHTIPTKRTKRLAVLDHIAQRFEPGSTYPESEVNEVLLGFHDDFAALRRYLVDELFLARDHNVYWRTGGTMQV